MLKTVLDGSFSYEVRKNAFKSFLIEFSQRLDTVCRNPSQKELCESYMKIIECLEGVVRHYTENGVCNNIDESARV